MCAVSEPIYTTFPHAVRLARIWTSWRTCALGASLVSGRVREGKGCCQGHYTCTISEISICYARSVPPKEWRRVTRGKVWLLRGNKVPSRSSDTVFAIHTLHMQKRPSPATSRIACDHRYPATVWYRYLEIISFPAGHWVISGTWWNGLGPRAGGPTPPGSKYFAGDLNHQGQNISRSATKPWLMSSHWHIK